MSDQQITGITDHQLSRRRLLGAGAAASAGVVLSSAPPVAAAVGRRPPTSRRADVIVVGGGISGLTAAHLVAKAGRSVIVLEARKRVGGRTLNHPIGDGKITEVGGTFIGPYEDDLDALAAELGIGTFKTYNDGANVSNFGGKATRYSANDPTAFVVANPFAADVVEAVLQLDQMAAQVSPAAPWSGQNALDWDSQTLETWKRANLATPEGRAAFDAVCEPMLGADPRDLSLLFALWYIGGAGTASSPGTVERLIGTAGGGQDSRFIGGSQLISIKLAQGLGRRVILGTPARRILHQKGAVIVESDRDSYKAKQVIVAIPPALAARIDYEPGLPAQRDNLMQRMPVNTQVKVEATYDKPFWRDDGLTGQAFGDLYISATFDQSPPDGSPGVLAGFLGGEKARAWYKLPDDATRRKTVLNDFATYFGPQALKPRDYFEMRWPSEVWSRGAHTALMAPGVLLDYGQALRVPVGRIHWAGTETSDYWIGFMSGAVRAGKRAAGEVLSEL